jgi:hypothetical protein
MPTKIRLHISLILSALCFLTLGCKQTRILVYDTSSSDIQLQDEQWIADNDTLLIAYSFWAEGGKLSCVIFNKTDRQLFLDWKNSAFIVNDRKVEFWNDAVQFTSNSRGSSVSYQTSKTSPASMFNWEWLTRSIGTQYSSSYTSGTLVTNERITSIPPRSYIGLERFTLLGELLYASGPQSETILEPRPTNSSKMEKVTKVNYDFRTSPLRFRCFLTYAFTEDMRVPHSINNSFWLSSISDMSFRHFEGKTIGRNTDGTLIHEKPLKKRKSFYLRYTK